MPAAFLVGRIFTHLSAVDVLLAVKLYCQHINTVMLTTCTPHFAYIFIKTDRRRGLIGFGGLDKCLFFWGGSTRLAPALLTPFYFLKSTAVPSIVIRGCNVGALNFARACFFADHPVHECSVFRTHMSPSITTSSWLPATDRE